MSGLRMVILVMMVLDGECKTCHRVPIPHNTHTTLPLHLHSTSSSHLLESHMTFHPPYDVKEWNLRLFIIPHDVARAAATIALVSDHGSSSSSSSGSEASLVVVVGCDREEAKQVSSVIKPWSTVTHSAHSKTNYAHSKNITLQMIRVPPNHRPLTLHHQTTTTTTTKGKEGENNHHLDHNLHYYLLSTSFLHHAPRHQNTSWGIDVEIIPNSQNNNKTAQNINNSAARNDIKTTQTNYKETQNNDNNKIKKDSSKTQYKKNATQNNNTAQNNNNKTTQINITTAGQDYNKTTQACSIFFFHIPGHTRAENAMGISCNTSTDGGVVEKQNTLNTNGGALAKENHSNTNKTVGGAAVAKEKTRWTTVDLWPVANQSFFHSPTSSSYLQERALKIEVGLTHIQVTETTGGKNTVLLYHQCSAPLQHFPALVLHVKCGYGTPECGSVTPCRNGTECKTEKIPQAASSVLVTPYHYHHNNTTTTTQPLPPQQNHHNNTTIKTPQRNHHENNTTTTSQQQHHHHNTTTTTPQPHYNNNNTSTPTQPPQHNTTTTTTKTTQHNHHHNNTATHNKHDILETHLQLHQLPINMTWSLVMSFSSNDKEKDWMVVMLGLIHTPNRTKGDILVGRCNATTTNTNTTYNTNHNTHTNNNHININTHTNSSHTNTNTHTNSSHTNTNTHTNSTHTNTNTHTNSSHTNTNTHTNSSHTNTNTHTNSTHTNTNTHTNSSHTHTASTTTTTRSNKETDTTEKMTRTLTSSHNTPRGIVIMVNQTHIQVNEKTVGQHVMLQTASHSFNTFPSLTLRVSCSVGTPYCGFISTCKSKDPDVFKPTLPSPNLFLASLTTKMVLVMVLVCVVCGTVLAWTLQIDKAVKLYIAVRL
ncbi:hypothetical protein Pcinc_014346 [Petrolisthes cinctipes]|uniref:Uncharacterized protein n=1 Tax=Petrolisthes cinctipes TaxID=88211 RepID=A0AAE1FV80_PETCI|nr:hypothetical protein Pcinc_014346 [Petrolisthes cinctipes]